MLTLVTGANGFLGLALSAQLRARGDQVRAICRRPCPPLESLGVEVVLADVRDADALAAATDGVDLVFHTAAVAGIWGPWTTYYQTNTLGTHYLVDACRRNGVPRLVFTSSPSVTFDGGDQAGVDESAPYPQRWLCHYPHTKALAEQAVLAANNGHTLLTCALRPHLIWGPGDRHLIPRLIERARRGQLRRVGPGTNLIDITYIDNAVQAHLLAADQLRSGSPVAGRAYFISDGQPVNCWSWINDVLALVDLPPVQRGISLSVAYAAGAVLENVYNLLGCTAEPRMTRFLALQLARHHYFDLSAARRDFGYAAVVDHQQAMHRLGESLRAPAGPLPIGRSSPYSR